jgi:hypothetical protein
MYNIRGASVIPIKYNSIEPDYLGETVYFIVTIGKKKGLYNANGTKILDEIYSDIKLVVSDNILFDAYVGKRKRAAVNADDKVILIR